MDDEEDEEEQDEEGEEAGASKLRSGLDTAQAAGEEDEEDDSVQRKLHLFRCTALQVSIKRLWDMLPVNSEGELAMEGYVELNLRLQKCLTQDFVLERAVDSAVGDWSEDVHEGQGSMPAEEFAMFLFELCSLWCGPGISLRAYLLFLNACFIAITEARGAHTVGLKALEDIERLPKAFFDLLTLQGWAKTDPAPPAVPAPTTDPAEALNAWYAANLTTEAMQQAMLQVQRQVFQVTHDVRSVFLFRDHDGRENEEHDNLHLVKHASRNLAKVSRAQGPKGLPAARRIDSRPQRVEFAAPVSEQPAVPWWPQTHSRVPGLPGKDHHAAALAAVATTAAQRRNHSVPARPGPRATASTSAPGAQLVPYSSKSTGPATGAGTLALASWESRSSRSGSDRGSDAIPVGRAFETTRARPKGRGLMLAGQAVASGSSGCGVGGHSVAEEGMVATRPETGIGGESQADSDISAWRLPYPLPTASMFRGPEPEANSSSATSAAAAWSQHIVGGGASGLETYLEPVEHPRPAHCLEDAHFLPPYKLPKNPAELYQKQAGPLMATQPGHIVFNANKMQVENRLVPAPFEKSLRKLPSELLPQGSEAPAGPLGHPQEPVWTEMHNRLQAILGKQSRRADRRRKRRARAKLLRGRSRQPPKRSEGRELREYLDRAAAEHAQGVRDQPGTMGGEFLGKVHERWMSQRERAEMPRFRAGSVPSSGIGRHLYSLGESSPRAQHTVRPVYVPPPGATMVF